MDIPKTKRVYGTHLDADPGFGAIPIFERLTDKNDSITWKVLKGFRNPEYQRFWGEKARRMVEKDAKKQYEMSM